MWKHSCGVVQPPPPLSLFTCPVTAKDVRHFISPLRIASFFIFLSLNYKLREASYIRRYDIQYMWKKFPKATDYLMVRLGKAISSRRQFLSYREEHRQRLGHGVEPVTQPANVEASMEALPRPETDARQLSADTTTKHSHKLAIYIVALRLDETVASASSESRSRWRPLCMPTMLSVYCSSASNCLVQTCPPRLAAICKSVAWSIASLS